jgi:hypothetical protein
METKIKPRQNKSSLPYTINLAGSLFMLLVLSFLLQHSFLFRPVPIKDYDPKCINDDGELFYKNDFASTPSELIEDLHNNNHDYEDDQIDPLRFTEIAYKTFSDCPEEFCVLDELYKGNKPKEIAQYLGTSVAHVYNIEKRIKRLMMLRLDNL